MKKFSNIINFITNIVGIVSFLFVMEENMSIIRNSLVSCYWLIPIASILASVGAVYILNRVYKLSSQLILNTTSRVGVRCDIHPGTKYCFFVVLIGFLFELWKESIAICCEINITNITLFYITRFLVWMATWIGISVSVIEGYWILIKMRNFYQWNVYTQLGVLILYIISLVITMTSVIIWGICKY